MVVVDNASMDESLQGLENIKIPLVVLHNPVNRGFGAASNLGAAESKSNYLLFLNPDTRLYENSLSKCLEFLTDSKNTDIGVLGIQMLDEKGRIWRTCSCFPTAHTFLTAVFGLDRMFPETFKNHLMVDWDHAASRKVDHVMGSFYMVRSVLFEGLGGFDERFFVYLEDLDFSLRARQAGSDVYYYAGVSAYHRGGGVSEKVRATRLFYALRSRILYSYKHFDWVGATVVCLTTLCVEPFTRIVLAVLKLSARTIVETIVAYVRLWGNTPSMMTSRLGEGE